MSVIAAFCVPHPPRIIPEVGRGGEKQIEKTRNAYKEVARMVAKARPETIIITSPHSVMYSDYFHISPGKSATGSFASFRAPEVSFEESYDTELVNTIEDICREKDFPAGSLGQKDPSLDHGTMVPLYFIEQEYRDFDIVRIGLSGLSYEQHYRLGMIIKEAVEKLKRRVVFIASGDLSHKLQEYGPYGFAPEGPKYDERIMNVLSSGDFGQLMDFDEDFCDKAAECGHRSFIIMSGALDGLNVASTMLSHEDITGVGYGIVTFYPEKEDPSHCIFDIRTNARKTELEEKLRTSDDFVRLAYLTINEYILSGRIIDIPADISESLLTQKAGAFVSIHEHGKLRGCIGTIAPVTDCVASEIISNAVSASTRDPRFSPIKPDELPYLDISVDVLDAPEDISSPDELDVKKYGVIVTSGAKRGLLLPNLDGVDTVEDQIAIAKQKAGITDNETIKLQRFEVTRHL